MDAIYNVHVHVCCMLQLTVVLEVQVVGVATIGVALQGDLDSRHKTAKGKTRVRAMRVRPAIQLQGPPSIRTLELSQKY